MRILIKGITLFFFVTFTNYNIATNIPERMAIKTGFSYSLTQLELNPFSEYRRWYDRGIGSPFISLEYAFPIKDNELTVGFQIIQKGFQTTFKSPPNPDFEFEQSYQYLLDYIELPINYRRNYEKYSFTLGLIGSYLFDDTYRFSERQILKAQRPLINYNEISFSEQYPHPERYQRWDLGLNLGISKKITNSIDLEFTYQKHFNRVDNRVKKDLAFNVCFLFGIRYRFFSSK